MRTIPRETMRFLSLVLLLYALSVLHSTFAQSIPTRKEVSDQIDKALRRIESTKKIEVEATIKSELSANAEIFTGNVCSSSSSYCDETIFNLDVLTQILASLAEDALAGRASIESLASRLAKRAGRRITEAGWPEEIAIIW